MTAGRGRNCLNREPSFGLVRCGLLFVMFEVRSFHFKVRRRLSVLGRHVRVDQVHQQDRRPREEAFRRPGRVQRTGEADGVILAQS